MEKVPEICLIAPSQSLADLTKKVALERGLNKSPLTPIRRLPWQESPFWW